MKRRNPRVACMAARAGQQCPNTLLHLVGGLIGERDRQKGFGGNALLNQVRDAVSDDARLACSRARQHQHRPFGRSTASRCRGLRSSRRFIACGPGRKIDSSRARAVRQIACTVWCSNSFRASPRVASTPEHRVVIIPSGATDLSQRFFEKMVTGAIAALAWGVVFVPRDVAEINTMETAEALGSTSTAVKSRLLRALLMVREARVARFEGSPCLKSSIMRVGMREGGPPGIFRK